MLALNALGAWPGQGVGFQGRTLALLLPVESRALYLRESVSVWRSKKFRAESPTPAGRREERGGPSGSTAGWGCVSVTDRSGHCFTGPQRPLLCKRPRSLQGPGQEADQGRPAVGRHGCSGLEVLGSKEGRNMALWTRETGQEGESEEREGSPVGVAQ